MDALKSAHNWIKSNRIISTVGNALAPVLPIAGTIGKAAAIAGYGRRRRRVRRRAVVVLPSGQPMIMARRVVRRRRPLLVRRRRPLIVAGGSLRGILSNVHSFVKKNQLISKGLNHFGHARLAGVASSLGYGRRRRRVRRRGGANFFSTEQIAAPKF